MTCPLKSIFLVTRMVLKDRYRSRRKPSFSSDFRSLSFKTSNNEHAEPRVSSFSQRFETKWNLESVLTISGVQILSREFVSNG